MRVEKRICAQREYEINCDGSEALRVDARALRSVTCHSVQVYHHLAYSHAGTALHLCHATKASTAVNMLRAIAADDGVLLYVACHPSTLSTLCRGGSVDLGFGRNKSCAGGDSHGRTAHPDVAGKSALTLAMVVFAVLLLRIRAETLAKSRTRSSVRYVRGGRYGAPASARPTQENA